VHYVPETVNQSFVGDVQFTGSTIENAGILVVGKIVGQLRDFGAVIVKSLACTVGGGAPPGNRLSGNPDIVFLI